jgi:hypothetical protein
VCDRVTWEYKSQPRVLRPLLISDDETSRQGQHHATEKRVAIASHTSMLEDLTEIQGEDGSDDDQGDDVSGTISIQWQKIERARQHARCNHNGKSGGPTTASGS